MKSNINKKSVTILSMLLFSVGLLISLNIFAQAAEGLSGEIAAREAVLQAQIDDLAPVTYVVGEVISDGNNNDSIVFWVDDSGEHGLAAWPDDEQRFLNWYAAGTAAEDHGPGWRLPTKHELNLLFLQKDVVSGVAGGIYWSSSEVSSGLVWIQNFYSGSQLSSSRDAMLNVRAVRAF